MEEIDISITVTTKNRSEMNDIEQRNLKEYDKLYYNPFEEKSFEVLSKTKIFEKIIHKNRISFENKKILEIGFGSGNLIPTIINAGGLYYGLEISNSSIVKCKEKYGSLVIVDLIKDNQINYDDEQFDTVIMSHSLEHIKYEDKILEEVVRVLKPNGVLIIGVPSTQCQDNHLHFRHYTKEDSNRIEKRFNLKLRYIEGINSVGFINQLLSKIKVKKIYYKKKEVVNRVSFLKIIYYMWVSPIFSEIYARNLGLREINEFWFIFEKERHR